MQELTPLLVNEPDPLVIAIYAIGFTVALVLNVYAIYKMATLDHVKEEIAIKERLRAQGVWTDEDEA